MAERFDTLATFIRHHRKRQDLSLRGLAERAGVNHSAVSRLESGEVTKPTAGVLNRIAAALGVPAEDLHALTGSNVPAGLPSFAPYLRAKYDLPSEAVAELDGYFDFLKTKYGIDGAGPAPGEDEHAA